MIIGYWMTLLAAFVARGCLFRLGKHSTGRRHGFTERHFISHLGKHELDGGHAGKDVKLIDHSLNGRSENLSPQPALTPGEFHAETSFDTSQESLTVEVLGEINGGHAVGGLGGDEPKAEGFDAGPDGLGRHLRLRPDVFDSDGPNCPQVSANALTSGIAGVGRVQILQRLAIGQRSK